MTHREPNTCINKINFDCTKNKGLQHRGPGTAHPTSAVLVQALMGDCAVGTAPTVRVATYRISAVPQCAMTQCAPPSPY